MISSSVPFCVRRDARAARQRRVERRHAPVVAAAGRLVGACERRADHHRVGAAGDRLRDVAAVAHAAVGDHAARSRRSRACAASAPPRRRRSPSPAGRRCRARRASCRSRPGRRRRARRPRRCASGAGPCGRRRSRRRRPGTGTSRDELLQVQRLGDRRETCSAETTVPWITRMSSAGLERDLVVLAHALRRERRGRDDALLLDLPDPLGDQLGLDRLAVDLLHLARGDARAAASAIRSSCSSASS